jgi:phosphoenolpyruvate---glycerone phosphotransferase subunit DhaL
MKINQGTTRELIEAIANTVIESANELTDLDRAIGDADHGVNLERGFKAVLKKMDRIGALPLADALNEVGTTLILAVGGASGPLYGKLFATIGKQLTTVEGELTKDALVGACEESIKVLKALGKSDVGQKTMLDVLVPSLDELRAGEGKEVLRQVRERACSAAQETVPMIARRGRASFLGERSQGHMDPGARSSQIIVGAVCNYLEARL